MTDVRLSTGDIIVAWFFKVCIFVFNVQVRTLTFKRIYKQYILVERQRQTWHQADSFFQKP
jgi:hypothetical protein